MPRNVSSSTEAEVLRRAGRRCECHAPACKHHRPAARCPKRLRDHTWHIQVREERAGEKLWNLVALCDRCWNAQGRPS